MFKEAWENILLGFIGEDGLEERRKRKKLLHAMKYWCAEGGSITIRASRKLPFAR